MSFVPPVPFYVFVVQTLITNINKFPVCSIRESFPDFAHQDSILTTHFTDMSDFLIKLHRSVLSTAIASPHDIAPLQAYVHLMLARNSDSLLNAWSCALALIQEFKRRPLQIADSGASSAFFESAFAWSREWNFRQMCQLNGTLSLLHLL